jgi:hypothetical protein
VLIVQYLDNAPLQHAIYEPLAVIIVSNLDILLQLQVGSVEIFMCSWIHVLLFKMLVMDYAV